MSIEQSIEDHIDHNKNLNISIKENINRPLNLPHINPISVNPINDYVNNPVENKGIDIALNNNHLDSLPPLHSVNQIKRAPNAPLVNPDSYINPVAESFIESVNQPNDNRLTNLVINPSHIINPAERIYQVPNINSVNLSDNNLANLHPINSINLPNIDISKKSILQPIAPNQGQKFLEYNNEIISDRIPPHLSPLSWLNMSSLLTLNMAPRFISAFVASFSLIVISELGDKTFFIAALMAMKHSHITVFCGALSALALMTVLSAIAGFALPKLLDKSYTHIASILLFLVFGVRMIYDASYMSADEANDELQEVEAELNKKDADEYNNGETTSTNDSPNNYNNTDNNSSKDAGSMSGGRGRVASFDSTLEIGGDRGMYMEVEGEKTEGERFGVSLIGEMAGRSTQPSLLEKGGKEGGTNNAKKGYVVIHRGEGRSLWRVASSLIAKRLLNPIFLQAFTLTFLAEWGDRSQIATIALAASRDVWGVNVGAVLGHALCTGIAVAGGKILASSISEKVVTYIGGGLFILFGILGAVMGV